MNKALVKINAESGVLVFRAKGHAEAGKRGNDIVCAAASILTMTLAKQVTEAYKAGWIDDSAICQLSPEETEISCVVQDEDVFGELARIYLTIASGYELLADHYPEHIKFKSSIRV